MYRKNQRATLVVSFSATDSQWEVSVTSLETLNTASTLAANLSKIFTKEKRKKEE